MILQILIVIGACVWIAKACNPFEDAADYLGRNMKAGIKGATINAIASSLPELLTTMSFLFLYNNTAGFASGVATTAGSAVFNILVIPAVVIGAVFFRMKKNGIEVDRKTIIRDGSFYIASIIALVIILNQPTITFVSGLILLSIYAVYVVVLIKMNKGSEDDSEEDEEDEVDETYNVFAPPKNRFVAFLKFDYTTAFNSSGAMTDKGAWISLLVAVAHVAVACHLLAGAVVSLAGSWGMSTFFVAVVLASAATSVPDTIMSVKDGLKGNYDDAISNAIGSNIFDICVSLGLPLTLYTAFNGAVTLGMDGHNVVELLAFLVVITITALIMFLVPKKIKLHTAFVFLLMYGGYVFYALSRGAGVAWAVQIGEAISNLI